MTFLARRRMRAGLPLSTASMSSTVRARRNSRPAMLRRRGMTQLPSVPRADHFNQRGLDVFVQLPVWLHTTTGVVWTCGQSPIQIRVAAGELQIEVQRKARSSLSLQMTLPARSSSTVSPEPRVSHHR